MYQWGSSQVTSAFEWGFQRLCLREGNVCGFKGWVVGSEGLSLVLMPHLTVLDRGVRLF